VITTFLERCPMAADNPPGGPLLTPPTPGTDIGACFLHTGAGQNRPQKKR
jgi:hypothetical protein